MTRTHGAAGAKSVTESATSAKTVDVAMVLEGAYPFATGGVSSWVDTIITGMPELTFGIVFLGESCSERREFRYAVPPNVAFVEEVGVYDQLLWRPPVKGDRRAAVRALGAFIDGLGAGRITSFEELFALLGREEKALSMRDIVHSSEVWEILTAIYRRTMPDVSFPDFFWTWRLSYHPVLQLLYTVTPPARVYHALSTGWAGFLSVAGAKRHGRPLLLTEHGISTNERRIEVSEAEWRHTSGGDDLVLRRDLDRFKELWINLFEALGHLTREHAREIFSLSRGSRDAQVALGAPAEKISVIPRGVKLGDYCTQRPIKPRGAPKTIGFVGSITPMEDVKTFIRACRIVAEIVPYVEVLVIGSGDGDSEYERECLGLASLSGLGDTVKFLGKVDPREYFPLMDALVVTGASEEQPLAILEGYCSGVPCVATGTGACPELVNGAQGEDRALGPSGFITSPGSPRETAEAIVRLLTNGDLWKTFSAAASARVRRFYDCDEMLGRYRAIYRRYMESMPAKTGAETAEESGDDAAVRSADGSEGE